MPDDVEIPDDVDSVALKFLDINGKPREIRIPPETFDVVKEEGMSFDSSNLGFSDVSKSDMIAVPDPSTMRVLDHGAEKVAVFLCEMRWPDGTPFEGDPRYLLRKTMGELSEEGIEIHVKPEYEFHILDRDNFEPIDSGQYIEGRTDQNWMVGEMSKAMKDYDFKVEKIHHEVAPGQYEIEPLPYDDPLQAADEFVFIREIIKEKAAENGVFATFMPKPLAEEAGNGFHVHLALYEDGEYMFSPDKLNGKASSFLGGLLNHAKALSAVVSPTINSYKRLVPGYEAPVYISWGGENRSVLVRIPAYGTEEQKKGRIEYRAGDASGNIYFMLNSLIRAGMDGMEKSADPGEEVTDDLFTIEDDKIKEMGIDFLPSSLSEALNELEKDEVVKDSLGESYEHYLRMKREEVGEFNLEVTNWELRNYLDY